MDLFGKDKAFLPLKLHQALKDDKVALETGYSCLVGTKDPSGRSILLVDSSRQDRSKYTRESMTRSVWYILHAVLMENTEAQRKGLVILGSPRNATYSQWDSKQTKMNLSSLQGCLPVRCKFHNNKSYHSRMQFSN